MSEVRTEYLIDFPLAFNLFEGPAITMKCTQMLHENLSMVWVHVSDLRSGHCHFLVLQLICKTINDLVINFNWMSGKSN